MMKIKLMFLALVILLIALIGVVKVYHSYDCEKVFISFVRPANVTIFTSGSDVPVPWHPGNGFWLSQKDFMIVEEPTPFQVRCAGYEVVKDE